MDNIPVSDANGEMTWTDNQSTFPLCTLTGATQDQHAFNIMPNVIGQNGQDGVGRHLYQYGIADGQMRDGAVPANALFTDDQDLWTTLQDGTGTQNLLMKSNQNGISAKMVKMVRTE